MTVPESRQGARPRPTGSQDVGAEVRPATNQDYSELPAPAGQVSQGSNTGKPPVKSALKQPQAAAQASQSAAAAAASASASTAKAPSATVDASKPGGSLLDGKFDEGESHNSFLDALKAWRGEKTTEPSADGSD